MKRLALTFLFVVLLLLTACTPTSVSEPSIPSHFTTYTDELGLFSISYPSDWEVALYEIEGLEAFLKNETTSWEGSLVFLAGLPTGMESYVGGETYDPNINIAVAPLPISGLSLDKQVEAEYKYIEYAFQDYHEFSRIKTTIDGREAIIVDWEGTYPGLLKIRCLQMSLFVERTFWTVTTTTSPEDFSGWEDDFYAIVRSLRVLK